MNKGVTAVCFLLLGPRILPAVSVDDVTFEQFVNASQSLFCFSVQWRVWDRFHSFIGP